MSEPHKRSERAYRRRHWLGRTLHRPWLVLALVAGLFSAVGVVTVGYSRALGRMAGDERRQRSVANLQALGGTAEFERLFVEPIRSDLARNLAALRLQPFAAVLETMSRQRVAFERRTQISARPPTDPLGRNAIVGTVRDVRAALEAHGWPVRRNQAALGDWERWFYGRYLPDRLRAAEKIHPGVFPSNLPAYWHETIEAAARAAARRLGVPCAEIPELLFVNAVLRDTVEARRGLLTSLVANPAASEPAPQLAGVTGRR